MPGYDLHHSARRLTARALPFAAIWALCTVAVPGSTRDAQHGADQRYPATIVYRDVKVQMQDGTRLATDIYLPSERGDDLVKSRFPVILIRTPYDRVASLSEPQKTALFWTQNGYAVALQDVRGTHGSEGVFRPMLNEGDDGYDTVEWLAKQPWSNGKVGTTGQSYVGGAQILLAAKRPPGLVASIPTVAATDQFKNSWVSIDGVQDLATSLLWTGYVMQDALKRLPPATSAKAEQELKALDIDSANLFDRLKIIKVADTLPIRDIPAARHMPWWNAWLDNLDNRAFFSANEGRSTLNSIAVPMLHIGGWYDLFQRNSYENYTGIVAGASNLKVRRDQRLIMMPHGHGRCATCLAFPDEAIDPEKLQLAWMDKWLKGRSEPFFDHPVILYVLGENRWRAERAWPLPDAKPTRYYLSSQGNANSLAGNGALVRAAPTDEEPADTYDYDPRKPVPTLGGNALTFGGATDQTDVEERSDVLVYTTPVLAADVEVTGEISATLYAATSATDTDWWVKLVDVHPDGKAYNIVNGVVRARYRKSRDRPEPVTPGAVEKYLINVWATSNVFKKGHRIRLEVTSSNFPWGARNPNQFIDVTRATERDLVVARQQIFHNAKYPSNITLPIIPADRVRNWIPLPFGDRTIGKFDSKVIELPASKLPR
jgi:putative CocE/NonD family hydrolase